MASEGCIKFFKVILMFVNSVFLLVGLLMLAFGIALKCFASDTMKVFNSAVDPQIIKIIPFEVIGWVGIFMVILGCIVTLIAVLGFFGACCQVMCMLVAYAVILILILLGELALIIFVAGFPQSVKKFVQQEIKTISNFTLQDIQIYSNGTILLPTDYNGLVWAGLQFEVGCCGLSGPSDYTPLSNLQRTENINGKINVLQVPLSCCQRNSSTKTTYPTSQNDFTNFNGCINAGSTTDPAINQKPCYDGVQNLLNTYSRIPIGIAAGTICLQVILIILSSCLAHVIRKSNSIF